MITENTSKNFEALSQIMLSYPNNITKKTEENIQEFLSFCTKDMENNSEKLLSVLFLKAFNNLIGTECLNENIYLKKFEIPQIQLFNILIDKFPFVKSSQQVVNDAIVDLLSEKEEATIIDIGIGVGTQVCNIIEKLKEGTKLQKVKIIGIEPAKEALNKAEKAICNFNANTPFEIEFIQANDFIENIDFKDYAGNSKDIVVNASLTLHHIQSDKTRSEVINRIKEINPAAFLLIEPNSDHFEKNFYKRFVNCYNHFYNIFKVIDKIEIDLIDKNALKLFFGREIEDIIGKQNEDRFELHEPAKHWINRLQKSGFSLKTNFLKEPCIPGLGIETGFHKEGFFGFTTNEETILSVIYAS